MKAAVTIIRWEAKVLLLRRTSGDPSGWGDHWCLPGGRCDQGEDPFDAALRETLEETGIVIPRSMLMIRPHRYKATDARGRVYEIQAHYALTVGLDPPAVTLSDEHDAFLWVGIDEYQELVMGDATRRILDELRGA